MSTQVSEDQIVWRKIGINVLVLVGVALGLVLAVTLIA